MICRLNVWGASVLLIVYIAAVAALPTPGFPRAKRPKTVAKGHYQINTLGSSPFYAIDLGRLPFANGDYGDE